MFAHRYGSFVVGLVSLGALAACSDGESDTEGVGSASVAVTQAPADVRCIEITAQGSRIVTRSFNVATGADTHFDMHGLPTGVVNFSAKAFNVACGSVSAGTFAGWVSDVVTVQIVPNVVVSVTLKMRRNGRAGVGVDFEQDPPQPSVYEPFGEASGEALLEKNGGIGFSAAWAEGGFNASIHDNFVIESGSLVYPGLALSGGHVRSSSQPSISGISRTLVQPLGASGTTKYLSLLIQPEGVLNEGIFSGFFGLNLGGGGEPELFTGKAGGGALGFYVMEDRGGGNQVASTGAAVVGQVTLLVVKAQFTDAMDRFTLYVNPQVGAPEPATGIVKENSSFGQLPALVLYSSGAFSLDEIRIGDTFASVTPPAP